MMTDILKIKSWQPTCELRWYCQTMKIDHEQLYALPPELQQKWEELEGIDVINEEWRPINSITEPRK